MDFIDTLIERSATYTVNSFRPDLKILPSRRAMIIGCVDPRVDPMHVLGLEPGEAAIIRNVGGRVNPTLFQTMAMLGAVSKAAGHEVGTGWNLILLQHTDCGIIGCYRHAPDLLAAYMGVAIDDLDGPTIVDPHKAVVSDVATLRANQKLPGGFTVSALVYDVATGRTEVVVPPSLLRPD